jgi:hypothetical protein
MRVGAMILLYRDVRMLPRVQQRTYEVYNSKTTLSPVVVGTARNGFVGAVLRQL